MLLSRDELIGTLFRETDRAQRMKTPLALILCGIADWPKWRSELGSAALASAQDEIAKRITRILRCYDSVGQIADGEAVLVLPGCNRINAETMAKRLDAVVFALPLTISGRQIQFSACFGVVSSGGRSPLVILRDAERTLRAAMTRGRANARGMDENLDPGLRVCPENETHPENIGDLSNHQIGVK